MNTEKKDYTLTKYEGRYLKISGAQKTYHFQVYKLENYDFDSCLCFTKDKQAGVYIFTKREIVNSTSDSITIGGLTTWKEIANHQLLYCGRTDNLKTRFIQHHKEGDLKGANFNCLSILMCDTHEDTEVIEKDLLLNHNFKFNEILNNWEPTMEEVASEVPLSLQEKSI